MAGPYSIELDGIELAGSYTNGEWLLTSLLGVHPGEYRRQADEVYGQHGVRFSGSDTLAAKVIEAEAEITYPQDPVAAEAAAMELTRAWRPRDADTELIVHLATMDRRLVGRPHGPSIDWSQLESGTVAARCVFTSSDPLWYGADHQLFLSLSGVSGDFGEPFGEPFGEGATGSNDGLAVNSGSAPTAWTATLTAGTGGLVNADVVVAGGRLSIMETIPEGSLLALDSRTQTMLLNGSPRVWQSPDSVWLPVPSGVSTVSLRAEQGSGSMTFAWKDASY